MSTQNPNWPLIDEALSFPLGAGPTAAPNPKYWVSIIARSQGTFTVSRGRQYATDQVQTSQGGTTVHNKDSAFDPNNAAGPFYPNVLPYRQYRRRGQYPATVNILSASQATAGLTTYDNSGNVSSLAAGVLPLYATGNYAFTTDGSGHYKNTVPGSPTVGTYLQIMEGFSITPGSQMSASVRVSSTSAITLQVIWIGTRTDGTQFSTGGVGSPVSVTGAVKLTSSYAPSSNTIGLSAVLFIQAGGSSACTVTADQWQVEYAAAASTYVTPNPWYPIFTGLASAFPEHYDFNGMRPVVDITTIDVFGWLSQRPLLSPAYHELLNLGPTFAYMLDEPAGATTFADATGAYPTPAAVRSVGTGALSLAAAGGSLAAAAPYLPMGIGGPVVAFTNPPGASPIACIDIGARGTVGSPTSGSWTRTFAVHFTAAQLAAINAVPALATIWWAQDNAGNSIWFYMNGTGALHIQFYKQGTVSYIQGVGTLTADSWHLINFVYDDPTGNVTTWIDDGISRFDAGPGPQISPTFVGGAVELIGGSIADGSGFTANNGWLGEIAYVSEVPFSMSSAQVALLYSTFRYGGSGLGTASSATRYQDVLRWANYLGPQVEDAYPTGQTIAYGPAKELLASRDQVGTDVVSALQTVVDTENGEHFVARDGTITLHARRARYNQQTPVITFGENTAAGEIPYTQVGFGYDPTRLANDALFTQTSSGTVFRYSDSTSVGLYGDITVQRSVNSLNPLEVNDAMQYIVGRNKNPQRRPDVIRVNCATRPASWGPMLKLELGMRCRVMRRSPAPAVTVQLDGFVEKIVPTMDDQGNAYFDIQVSYGGSPQFWVAGSTRLNVHTATTVNGTSLVIDAMADAATNVLRSNISAAGDASAWVIGYGTASAELVTITAVPVTTTGYSTATLTIGTCTRLDTGATGTGFRFVHAINSTLQDIGGYVAAYGLTYGQVTAALAPYISPAGALDALCALGTSTVLGY